MSNLNEYLPLKQGLRLHSVKDHLQMQNQLNEYLPLKQGLRHSVVLESSNIVSQ